MGCISSSEGSNVQMIDGDLSAADFLEKDMLFSHLNQSQLKKVQSYFEVVTISGKSSSHKTVLLTKGSVADALYIVVKGNVSFLANFHGSSKVLRKLQPYDKFGEFGVINGASSRVDVVLIGNGSVLKVKRDTLKKQAGTKVFARLEQWLVSTESAMMAQKLKDVDFMSRVQEDDLYLIARLFQSRILQKGEHICKEGEMNDKFFIVAKGTFVLTMEDDASLFLELSRLRAGDTFGEVALLGEQKMNTTATALEESMVFTLRRSSFEEFEELVPSLYSDMKQAISERDAVALVSNRIPFVQSLPPNKLHLLSTVARMKKYPASATIFKEGSKEPLTFYIIARGSAEVMVRGKAVRTMKQGDYFGEVSLVSDRAHTAAVVVSSSGPLFCLEISQGDFNALLMRERTILSEIQIRVLGEKLELKHLLNHPLGQEFFLKQLEKEFAKENIEFWSAVDRMESLGKQRFDPRAINALGLDMETFKKHIQSMLKETAESIHNDFIADDAPHQVNLKAETLDSIKDRVTREKYSYEMYHEAKMEIYNLMERDNFTRFRNSPLFKELLDTIGVYGKREMEKVKSDIDMVSKDVVTK